MNEHYDSLETRDPLERQKSLIKAVRAQIAHAKTKAPIYKSLLADVIPEDIKNTGAIAKLPITRNFSACRAKY